MVRQQADGHPLRLTPAYAPMLVVSSTVEIEARPAPVTRKAAAPPEEMPDAAKIEAKRTAEVKTPPTATSPQQPDDAQEVCVFAFRLSRSARDEIHRATGSAKASKFVRAIVLAGARGDMKAVQEAVDEIRAGR